MPQDLPALLRFCHEDAGLKISGLMCIPPADVVPAPHFKLLPNSPMRISYPC